MTRRKHGEGTIVKRADGRYMAALMVETEKGKKRKYVYGKTSKEVQEKLNQAKYDRKQGMLVTEKSQRLDVYLNRWLEEVHKPSIGPSAYVHYRGMLDKHIIPALGHVQVQKLTPQRVQAFYAAKLDEGLKAKTVNMMHIVLHMALENAVKWGMVGRNVCDAVTKPREEPFEPYFLTKEQAKRLIDAARGGVMEGLIVVAVSLGLRHGEVVGLKWEDIDFEGKCLYVRRTVSHVGNMGLIERPPKTKSGRRKILLPDFLVVVLHQEQARQQEQRVSLGSKWRNSGYVFPNTIGGFFNESNFHAAYKRLLKRAGLPDIRFHDLRHSAATLLIAMGVNPKVVQEILGHSTFTMTMNLYGHVLPSMQEDGRQKLNDFFGE